ncbi:MAG: hypothetical protein B7Z71_10350, partial [Acidocella sp. 21-58-7]
VAGKKKGAISDTVGFIQNLPHELIAAFKSTLSELAYAQLLLQVIDLSDKNWRNHIRVVQSILEELGVFDTPMLYVFNKIDLIDLANAGLAMKAQVAEQRLAVQAVHARMA